MTALDPLPIGVQQRARGRREPIEPVYPSEPFSHDQFEVDDRTGDEDSLRRRSRRDPGNTCRYMFVALSGFCLILAVVLPHFVYPRLASLPADPQGLSVLRATGATAVVPDLSRAAGARVVRDADVEARAFMSDAGGWTPAGVVNWRLATQLVVNGTTIDARYEDISLDRRTGRPVNCCGDQVVTQQGAVRGTPVTHQGLITFPFNTEKRDYQVWDGQLRRSRTAAFDGIDERNGLRVYRFVASTPATAVGTMRLPGLWFGMHRTPSVTATAMYTDTRTYWIEPATGSPVDLHDQLTQQYTYGGRTVTAMKADLSAAPMSPSSLDQIKQGAAVLPWLRGRASLFLVFAGLLLLLPTLRRLITRRR